MRVELFFKEENTYQSRNETAINDEQTQTAMQTSIFDYRSCRHCQGMPILDNCHCDICSKKIFSE